MISINVEGAALYWYQTHVRSKLLEGIYRRWIDYMTDVSAIFSNRPFENPYSDGPNCPLSNIHILNSTHLTNPNNQWLHFKF